MAPSDRFGYAPAGPPSHDAVSFGPAFPGTEHVDVRAIFEQGGYNSPRPITNPLAKSALWVSVFSIFVLPLVISVVLALVALVRAENLPDRVGFREAVAVLIYNAILVAIGFMTYWVFTL